MKNKKPMSGDPVIQTVLEQIFRASEIDPSTIWPDNHFQDLGLSKQMIHHVFEMSAQSLGLKASFADQAFATPREMVDLLRQIGSSQAS